jgi:hypothetical protein
MIAVGQSAAGDVERTAQKMLINFGRTHVLNAAHGRASLGVHHAERSSEIQPKAGIGGDQDFDIGPSSEPFSMSIVGQ